MALIKKPVTGMRDILPNEMEVRQYCMGVIRDTYKQFGFTEIETPIVESIENLCSKQGGDNEKLIFRILKRGEKLNLENATTQEDVTDSGLRYDLTVPLVRYYAAHQNELPQPFKALQMGNVFRADRPQKGRFRQFMQCDIDIIGEAGIIAEIESILALTTVLGRLGFKGFKVRINDRRLLRAMSSSSGFNEEQFGTVCVILDKLDKIGFDGVREELMESCGDASCVDKCLEILKEGSCADIACASDEEAIGLVSSFCNCLTGDEVEAVKNNLTEIISSVNAAKEADFEVVFDPTLVRGMGYYTGTIFEIAMPQYGGSCGGGGRYDEMVARFTGQSAPAIGFSIGFERIVMILMEEGFRIPGDDNKCAYLIEKGMPGARLTEIIRQAAEARKSGKQILVVHMNKNKKFQKEQLTAQGYTTFEEFYKEVRE